MTGSATCEALDFADPVAFLICVPDDGYDAIFVICVPALAAEVGGLPAGADSSCAMSRAVSLTCLGTGYMLETDPSCE